MQNIEQEYKWQAKGITDFTKVKMILIKLSLEQKTKRQLILDSYFDDPGHILGFHKVALRLRSINSNFEITVKEASEIKNGLAQRSEETVPLSATGYTKAMAQFRRWYSKRWPDLGRPQQIFTIKNRREIIILSSPAFTAELSFDNCDIKVPSKTIKFYEIEFELKKGSKGEFTRIASEIQELAALKPVTISKVATAVSNL